MCWDHFFETCICQKWSYNWSWTFSGTILFANCFFDSHDDNNTKIMQGKMSKTQAKLIRKAISRAQPAKTGLNILTRMFETHFYSKTKLYFLNLLWIPINSTYLAYISKKMGNYTNLKWSFEYFLFRQKKQKSPKSCLNFEPAK